MLSVTKNIRLIIHNLVQFRKIEMLFDSTNLCMIAKKKKQKMMISLLQATSTY